MDISERLILSFDRGLRALTGVGGGTGRDYPAAGEPDTPLPPAQRRHAAGLMRVNHAGEIAAQALYHGQSLTARAPTVKAELEAAAREEDDHLNWCRRRLSELGDRPSRLDPLWYLGSFTLGAVAAVMAIAAPGGVYGLLERRRPLQFFPVRRRLDSGTGSDRPTPGGTR